MTRTQWIIVGGVVALILLRARPVFAAKPGTIISNKPEIEHARRIAAAVWTAAGYTLTITSGLDSLHGEGSLHPEGLAEDYRTRDVAPSDLARMVSTLKARLGSLYDVVLESDHLHVEFDPS